MGLDIYHEKLVTNPREDDFGYCYDCEEWEMECNVPFEVYKPFLVDVLEPEIKRGITVVKNEKHLAHLKKDDFFSRDDSELFIGEYDDKMKKRINAFVFKEKLCRYKMSEMRIKTGDGIKYIDIYFSETVVKKGFYFKQVGYQRKGMNDFFSEHFGKYTFYGKKEDFELAYECIGGEWYRKHFGEEVINEMKTNFKENFLDTFEFGKSLMDVSY